MKEFIYTKDKPLRVFTAFSGYDSQCMALDRLGIPYELIGWSEIDKYAIQAHNAIYPQWADRNYGDISKINWDDVPDFDLFTYSSPCQDFSNAGLQRGGEEGSGTRSSLLWECRKTIIVKKPKYLLMENVAALVSKKFLPLFNKWQRELESYGYSNFAQVLNAKDYGVPQNRKRIFLISILGEVQYHFPQPFPLDKRLKDILEKEVDEKYYLRQKTIKSFSAHCKRKQAEGCGFKFEPKDGDGISNCIATLYGNRQTDTYIKEPKIIELGNIAGEKNKWKSPQVGRVYSPDGLSPTLNTCGGGSHEPKIADTNFGNKRLDKLLADKSNELEDNCFLDAYNQTVLKNVAVTITARINDSNHFIAEKAESVLCIPQATKQGYAEVEVGGVFDAAYTESKTRRGRVQENGTISPTLCTGNELCVFEGIEQIGYVNDGKHQQDYVQGTNGVSRAVCAGSHASTPHLLKTQLPNYRIRKLTPRECFRLMDVTESDIDKIQNTGLSESQQYKMAGNSIVVACMEGIFKNLFSVEREYPKSGQLQLF